MLSKLACLLDPGFWLCTVKPNCAWSNLGLTGQASTHLQELARLLPHVLCQQLVPRVIQGGAIRLCICPAGIKGEGEGLFSGGWGTEAGTCRYLEKTDSQGSAIRLCICPAGIQGEGSCWGGGGAECVPVPTHRLKAWCMQLSNISSVISRFGLNIMIGVHATCKKVSIVSFGAQVKPASYHSCLILNTCSTLPYVKAGIPPVTIWVASSCSGRRVTASLASTQSVNPV